MANNAHPSRQMTSLLLTRAQADARRFVDTLDPDVVAQTQVVVAPLLRIEAVDAPIEMDADTGVIFTSAKAVGFAAMGAGRAAYCVGAMTAQAATAKGWQVRLTAETADALVATITANAPLIHLAGRHQRGDIAKRLTAKGLICRRAVIYDQHLQPLSDTAQEVLDGDKPVIVPLFSPRIAGQFADQARNLTQAHLLAISAAAAQALDGKTPASLHIAAAPTAQEMRRGVEKLLQQTSLP